MNPILKDPEEEETGGTPVETITVDTTTDTVVEETPVTEIEEKAEKLPVSFDDFTREITGAEPVKKEEKKIEEEEKVEETPATQQQTRQQIDISQFTPQEQHLLKRMANPAKEWAISLHKTRAELTKKLAETQKQADDLAAAGTKNKPQPSLYDHEEAYQLSEEFKTLREDAGIAQGILDHWEQQLIKSEAGEDWQNLQVDAQGKIILGAKVETTAASKLQLQKNIRHAESQLQRVQQKAQEIVSSHKQQVTQRKQALQAEEDKYFPQFKDPNFGGWKLANGVLDTLKAQGFGDNPLAPMLAKAAAANTMLVNHLSGLNKTAGVAGKLKSDAKAGGPGASKQVSTTQGKKKEISIEDFQSQLKD